MKPPFSDFIKPKTASRRKAKPAAEPRLSRQRKPEHLSADDWQRTLRRQFGREQGFELRNLGDAALSPVFSEFRVSNRDSGGHYRVTIRGSQPGDNLCTCLDFATNDLGTCKHIEFTLARLSARRGGKAALARGFSPPYSEVFLHHAGQRTVRFRPGADCPPALRARAGKLFGTAADGVLPPERMAELDGFITAARKSSHELRIDDRALTFAAQLRDADHRRQVLAEAYPRGAADKGLNKLIKARLYPYQAEGALFAARNGRVLLGDEMGLGKTVQAIAAAELMARHFGVQRVLVVCPTSLKHQWQREIARFAGRPAQVLQGLRAAREQQYREDAFCRITNYEALVRDADLITAWAPELLIVDEAQRVKNWNTLAARALRRIAGPEACPYAIVLTGTPLENRLQELIAIVQLVDQHRLGPTWRLLHEHQQVDEAGRVVGYRDLNRIGSTLAPILLRRRKAEVLAQLPERMDKTLFVPMTREQRVHHDENGQIVMRIVSRWRKTGYLSDADQRRLQCALQNMRMSCNSTFLLDHETDFGHKADELVTLLEELFEQPDAKAVVFSQWLGTHEILARRLRERGWDHVLFHGSVPGDKRGALVDRFVQEPACRLFLSTDAGGVGLNLQHAAAIVVNMDLPWNPAVLEQRIGRVHRMGQQRGVQVINFVAQGSIEEGMLGVLAFKKSLFAGVLDGGDSAVFMNGTRLAKFMESVDEVTGAMGRAEEALATPSSAPRLPQSVMDERVIGEPAPAQPTVPDRAPGVVPDLAAWDAEAGEPMAPPIETSADAPGAASATPPADPWAPLLEAGLRWVESLAQPGTDPGRSPAGPRISTDPRTGQRSLTLPLPDPATVQRLAEGLAGLLAQLRR
ncbi:DEAD/DEAH box helicase [Aquabacterium sp.]|uniref:DEAD/DEAH box helicase n=1 Tax=Aquabacterium sp. TaxID=1872578 RepID=UPI002B833E21|nr:SNF2-related protein [Aquabacterium sp.]HSW08921.1 SNF2-related protein [Aquabacterium sp.]